MSFKHRQRPNKSAAIVIFSLAAVTGISANSQAFATLGATLLERIAKDNHSHEDIITAKSSPSAKRIAQLEAGTTPIAHCTPAKAERKAREIGMSDTRSIVTSNGSIHITGNYKYHQARIVFRAQTNCPIASSWGV